MWLCFTNTAKNTRLALCCTNSCAKSKVCPAQAALRSDTISAVCCASKFTTQCTVAIATRIAGAPPLPHIKQSFKKAAVLFYSNAHTGKSASVWWDMQLLEHKLTIKCQHLQQLLNFTSLDLWLLDAIKKKKRWHRFVSTSSIFLRPSLRQHTAYWKRLGFSLLVRVVQLFKTTTCSCMQMHKKSQYARFSHVAYDQLLSQVEGQLKMERKKRSLLSDIPSCLSFLDSNVRRVTFLLLENSHSNLSTTAGFKSHIRKAGRVLIRDLILSLLLVLGRRVI